MAKDPTPRSPVVRDMPFHNLSSENPKRIVERAVTDGKITPDDASLLLEYVTERRATRALSPGRVNKILYNLLLWRKFVPKPFRDHTITDLYAAAEQLMSRKAPDGTELAKNTVSDTVAIFKPFYSWMIEEGYCTIPEKKLRAIKRPPVDKMTKTAEDILSPEEVEQLLLACTSSRDRALVHLMYEGGFRVGEIGNLQWRHIRFDETGAVVNVDFKTGKPRYVRLVMAKQPLAAWKKDHPDARPDAFVFLDRFGRPVKYPAVVKQLQRLVDRAGIRKHITPHTLRHSRITHLIREGKMGESVIKLMMWGSVDTDMFSTYLHLTGGDIDQQISEAYGLVDKKATNGKRIEPRQCPRCGEVNSPTAKFCAECGMSLTPEAAAEVTDYESIAASMYAGKATALPALSDADRMAIARMVAEEIMKSQKRQKRSPAA